MTKTPADGISNHKSPYETGIEFAQLFSRFEYALKRSGYLANKEAAQADWTKFARALGPDFFKHVVSAKIADVLVSDPPRKLMANGLTWAPEQPAPLVNVEELFVQGVCRVRNSYMHGEKFTGGPDGAQWRRDARLLEDALAVLIEARKQDRKVATVLDSQPETFDGMN